MVCQCRHHLNSGRFQCRSHYHCMAQHFCLSRLACWQCYNPVKQQYTIQAKKQHILFSPQLEGISFILDVSFVNSFVLSCPCWVQCLPVFFSPFRSSYSGLQTVFIFLLAPTTLGITIFFFVFFCLHSSCLLYCSCNCTLFHQLLQCLFMVWKCMVFYVQDMSCETLTLPRFLHDCVVFLSAQSLSIFSDLPHFILSL